MAKGRVKLFWNKFPNHQPLLCLLLSVFPNYFHCFFFFTTICPSFTPNSPDYFFFLVTLLGASPGGRRPWRGRSTVPICFFFEVRPLFPHLPPHNLLFPSSFTLHLPSSFPLLLQLNILYLLLSKSPLSLSSPTILSHVVPLWSKFQILFYEWGGTVTNLHPLLTHRPKQKHTHNLQLDLDVRLFLEKRLKHIYRSCSSEVEAFALANVVLSVTPWGH